MKSWLSHCNSRFLTFFTLYSSRATCEYIDAWGRVAHLLHDAGSGDDIIASITASSPLRLKVQGLSVDVQNGKDPRCSIVLLWAVTHTSLVGSSSGDCSQCPGRPCSYSFGSDGRAVLAHVSYAPFGTSSGWSHCQPAAGTQLSLLLQEQARLGEPSAWLSFSHPLLPEPLLWQATRWYGLSCRGFCSRALCTKARITFELAGAQ